MFTVVMAHLDHISTPLEILEISVLVDFGDTRGYCKCGLRTQNSRGSKHSLSSYFVRDTTEEQLVYLFTLQPDKLMLF